MQELIQDVTTRDEMKNHASRVITSTIRWYIAKLRGHNRVWRRLRETQLVNAIRVFHIKRNLQKNRKKFFHHAQMTRNHLGKLLTDVKTINHRFDSLRPDLFYKTIQPLKLSGSYNKQRWDSRRESKRKPMRVPKSVQKMATFLKRHRSVDHDSACSPLSVSGSTEIKMPLVHRSRSLADDTLNGSKHGTKFVFETHNGKTHTHTHHTHGLPHTPQRSANLPALDRLESHGSTEVIDAIVALGRNVTEKLTSIQKSVDRLEKRIDRLEENKSSQR